MEAPGTHFIFYLFFQVPILKKVIKSWYAACAYSYPLGSDVSYPKFDMEYFQCGSSWSPWASEEHQPESCQPAEDWCQVGRGNNGGVSMD